MNKMKTMTKYRREKPLKAFINRYALLSGTNCEKLSVGICEGHLLGGGQAQYRYNRYNEIVKFRVKFSPYILRKYRIKDGYDNDYYKNRKEKIDRYILGNFKACYRFVILHELGHIHFYQKINNIEKINKISLARKERYADAFALRYLKFIIVKSLLKYVA
jgi:hypothetical protein